MSRLLTLAARVALVVAYETGCIGPFERERMPKSVEAQVRRAA